MSETEKLLDDIVTKLYQLGVASPNFSRRCDQAFLIRGFSG
jgi:hypothetical protein